MTTIHAEAKARTLPSIPGTLQAAAGLCFYQLILLLFVTGKRFAQLTHWDAAWYRDIAIQGYQVTFPLTRTASGGSNIAFFPGFPIWTRILHQLFGLDGNLAVALAAELATVGLWTYFLLLLKRLRINPWLGAFLTLALLVQPGSFYYVVGYSESLFTFSLLGMIYWTDRFFSRPRSTTFFLLAAIHGGILSGTRFLGVALAGFPILIAFFQRRRFLPALSLSVLNLWGFISYLLYCHFKWGQWNIYWEANRIGWGVYFDPFKILHLSYYTEVFFFGNLSEILGRILTVISLGGLLWLLPKMVRKSDPLPGAIALLNLGLMVETIIGSHGMHSMVRYLLPIHALLFPIAGLYWQEQKKETSLGLAIRAGALLLFLFSIQVLFAIRYSRGEWVS